MEELMHNFNKILDDKREEIIAIAAAKKRENKKVINPDKLPFDISTTLNRINVAAEKKYKASSKYIKKQQEENGI
jgi:hypothetical protein|uniref:Uncharacterized protein n=1 Tax=viral metagenome TaxID=1070528 RepID=A0A6C0LIV6_9ZZZZ